MAKNKTQARTQTRTHTPKPIPALLEGSFSTAVENRVAEINNHLAREGRLTNDPLAILFRALRTDLKAAGYSFDRVPLGTETVVSAAPANAPKSNAPKKNAAPKAQKTQAAPVSTGSVRVITPEEIDTLQVAGSVDEENGAPYGKDSEGRALAPYGVKKDGSPMKRRGRVAAEESTESAPAPTQKAAPTPSPAATPVQAVEAAPEAVEAASTETEEVSAEETAAGDFDDLESVLADLDI